MKTGEYYDKLDEALVKGSNEVVKAWNWTFGRTRADLANLLGMAGWGINIVGLLANLDSLDGPPPAFTLPFLSVIPLAQTEAYNKKDRLDLNLHDDVKSIESKEFESLLSKVKIPYVAASLVSQPYDIGNYLGPGCALNAASTYIMRANPQKPRKDCVRRGLETIAEWARTFGSEKKKVPVYGGSEE